MRPSRFFFYQGRIEYIAAVIIEAGYQIPLLINVWGPEMMRGVVLDQLSCIVCYYLPVMILLLWFGNVKTVFLALSIIVGADTSCRYFFHN